MVDYKELLKRYINIVGEMEGVTFHNYMSEEDVVIMDELIEEIDS